MLGSYETFIHLSRYAKYLSEQKRRESWSQTVARYCNYWRSKYPFFPYDEISEAIYNLEIMPSMRAMMTAGPALDRDHVAGYNCCYLPIDDVRAFDEIMYILMCGTGVGFSVERASTEQLPTIAESFYRSETTIKVADSRIGWATAFREYLGLLYAGKTPKWDTSGVRPAGTRLKTFGGRASGPEPLEDLFRFAEALFRNAAGRKLNPLECHDLVCKIADIVVVGGVRRSALISLSDLSDDRMRLAKSGQWWTEDSQRALANNSAVYLEKPDVGIFMKEWLSLYESKSGERGIFNRLAAESKARSTGRRELGFQWGTNPCGEIILRPNGLCNLSEGIIRAGDDFETVRRKVELSTIIGTFQSTLTDFRYLRRIWSKNASEERLLGVSLTGFMDRGDFSASELGTLREQAVETNRKWAEKLGINQSASITTVKPSGTVSQLVDCASGIHARFSPYYIRAVRNDKKDPLSDFLIAQGVPYEEDVASPSNWVFMFPKKSPKGARLASELSALTQLNHYLLIRENYCEHNPSITVYVRDFEWPEVAAFVYSHFDELGGVSFLPYSDHVYRQAPYTEITEAEYQAAEKAFPKIAWETFTEDEDGTSKIHDLSCTAGYCEI